MTKNDIFDPKKDHFGTAQKRQNHFFTQTYNSRTFLPKVSKEKQKIQEYTLKRHKK